MTTSAEGDRRATAVPTTSKGGRTFARILAAARRVFGRDGYTAARMSDVAAEAELSMGGLYRYFENKTALFEAVIAGIHEELYDASRAEHATFVEQPYVALLEANFGYLSHYFAHRDVMRAFIEAANTDRQFRELWWKMRDRHVARFAQVIGASQHIHTVEGIDVRVSAEAMACMVEQCAYVWYAHEEMSGSRVPVETAGWIVTRAWFRMFFNDTDGVSELSPAGAAALLGEYRPPDKD